MNIISYTIASSMALVEPVQEFFYYVGEYVHLSRLLEEASDASVCYFTLEHHYSLY